MSEYDIFNNLREEYAEYPEDGMAFVWEYDQDCLSYNIDGDKKDLSFGDGETYSDYAILLTSIGGLNVFEVLDGCGGKTKIILKDSNKVENE